MASVLTDQTAFLTAEKISILTDGEGLVSTATAEIQTEVDTKFAGKNASR